MKKVIMLIIAIAFMLLSVGCKEHDHDWQQDSVLKEPTMTENGRARFVCRECGEVKEELLEKLPHIHLFEREYSKNELFHWHSCLFDDCTVLEGKNAHIWDEGKVVLEASNQQAGKKVFTCVICAQSREQIYHLGSTVTEEQFEGATEEKAFKNMTVAYKELSSDGDTVREMKVEYANGWIQYTEKGEVRQSIDVKERELSTKWLSQTLAEYSNGFSSFTYDENQRIYSHTQNGRTVNIQFTDGKINFISIIEDDKAISMTISLVGKTDFVIVG